MMTVKFKTNINCPNCVEKLTPYLDKIEGISWKVDTENPDNILTIESRVPIPEKVINLVKEAGFEIEEI